MNYSSSKLYGLFYSTALLLSMQVYEVVGHSCFRKNYKQPSFGILEDYFFQPFEKSMFTTARYKNYYERIIKVDTESAFIAQLSWRYERFLNSVEQLWQTEPRIPKIIHQIWLGPNPLPKKYECILKTWQEKHPGWVYKLWTDKDVEALNLVNKHYYDSTPSWAEKSNLLRYEILYRFGGLYVDTDFECLKSCNFLHHCCDFYVGLEYPPRAYDAFIIGNALIAAKPNHPILEAVVMGVKESWASFGSWSMFNQLERSGTRYFSRVIKKVMGTCEGVDIIFPSNVFYPYSGKVSIIPPESIGIHYWDASWLKK